MFKQDKWGNTYFFVDHDFNLNQMTDPNTGDKYAHNISQGGTYTEISRALNFWQNSKLKNLSLHAEYNGGIYKDYPINNAWLFGVEYFMDIFGVKGLNFSGFADFWWENHSSFKDKHGNLKFNDEGEVAFTAEHTVFTSEPQLWYNVGQHFGCNNLSVGGEVEISNNFGSNAGFMVRPCLGAKWDF